MSRKDIQVVKALTCYDLVGLDTSMAFRSSCHPLLHIANLVIFDSVQLDALKKNSKLGHSSLQIFDWSATDQPLAQCLPYQVCYLKSKLVRLSALEEGMGE